MRVIPGSSADRPQQFEQRAESVRNATQVIREQVSLVSAVARGAFRSVDFRWTFLIAGVA
jgi:hypothetical protein